MSEVSRRSGSVRVVVQACESRRLLSGGAVDLTFGGGDGVVVASEFGFDYGGQPIVQPDGKILVTNGQVIRRLLADGTPDVSFGSGGVLTPFSGTVGAGMLGYFKIRAGEDGTFVVSGKGDYSGPPDPDHPVYGTYGYRRVGIARYDANGQLDPTYSDDGVNVQQLSVFVMEAVPALQSDGSAIVFTSLNQAYRLQEDGSLDMAFGARYAQDPISPKNTFGPTDLLILDDDSLLFSHTVPDGATRMQPAVVRILADGTRDMSYAGTGTATLWDDGIGDTGSLSLLPRSDGSVYLMSGREFDTRILCLKPDGTPDATFADNGLATIDLGRFTDFALGGVVHPDDSVSVLTLGWHSLLGGGNRSDPVVTHWSKTGEVDMTFGVAGKAVINEMQSERPTFLLRQPDGKLIVGYFGILPISGAQTATRFVRLTAPSLAPTEATLDGRRLIVPSQGADDIINVTRVGSEIVVGVNGRPTRIFAATDVDVVIISAGAGNDRINIDPALGVLVEVYAQSGQDTIRLLAGLPGAQHRFTSATSGAIDAAGAAWLSYEGVESVDLAPPSGSPVVRSALAEFATRFAITFGFSEDVSASVSVDDFELTHDGTSVALTSQQLTVSNVGGRTRVQIQLDPTLNAGRYLLTLKPATVVNGSGLSNAHAVSADFMYSPGDITGNGEVDFFDLLVLARNYGRQDATRAQGDLDYDGKVGFSDLLILARSFPPEYGASLSAVQVAVPKRRSASARSVPALV
jgi:uncharacterized delta-60 repeat protein